MTIIQLVKNTSVTGEETFEIQDQDKLRVGPVMHSEFEATRVFDRVREDIERYGDNRKASETLKEFIFPHKIK